MLMAKMSGGSAQLKAMKAELGLLSRADGSARVSQGGTAVLCAVYAPAEVKTSKELPDRATLEVTVRPEGGMSGPKERLMEQFISSVCEAAIATELHPHSAISVTLQVENDAGGLLSCLTHACCLAMLDACIPMSSVFSALSCGFSREGELIVDPQLSQENFTCKDDPMDVVTFVVNSGAHDVLASYVSGALDVKQLQQALSATQEAAVTMESFYRKALQRKLSKDPKFTSLGKPE